MALGSSSFGTILQSSADNVYATNSEAVQNIAAANIPVETAGSIAWGGFDVCELSTTTEVDYTAYSTPPVETAGSIASAPIGSFASNSCASVSVASVSTSAPSTSSACCCSYSC